jgi:hypothetical protein
VLFAKFENFGHRCRHPWQRKGRRHSPHCGTWHLDARIHRMENDHERRYSSYVLSRRKGYVCLWQYVSDWVDEQDPESRCLLQLPPVLYGHAANRPHCGPGRSIHASPASRRVRCQAATRGFRSCRRTIAKLIGAAPPRRNCVERHGDRFTRLPCLSISFAGKILVEWAIQGRTGAGGGDREDALWWSGAD